MNLDLILRVMGWSEVKKIEDDDFVVKFPLNGTPNENEVQFNFGTHPLALGRWSERSHYRIQPRA